MEIVLERNYLRMINECCPTPKCGDTGNRCTNTPPALGETA